MSTFAAAAYSSPRNIRVLAAAYSAPRNVHVRRRGAAATRLLGIATSAAPPRLVRGKSARQNVLRVRRARVPRPADQAELRLELGERRDELLVRARQHGEARVVRPKQRVPAGDRTRRDEDRLRWASCRIGLLVCRPLEVRAKPAAPKRRRSTRGISSSRPRPRRGPSTDAPASLMPAVADRRSKRTLSGDARSRSLRKELSRAGRRARGPPLDVPPWRVFRSAARTARAAP